MIKEYYNEMRIRKNSREWNEAGMSPLIEDKWLEPVVGMTDKEAAELFVLYLNQKRRPERKMLAAITRGQNDRRAKGGRCLSPKETCLTFPSVKP